MKNNFKQEIDTRLEGLEWHGEAEVLRRVRCSRRPVRLRTVVIVTALLALLGFTAVALTLQYSARYNSLRQARSALSARYGLTDEMLDLFQAQIEETADGTVVRFVPLNLNLDAMGVYTVTRTKEGKLLASWSHDDVDLTLRDDLGAEAWGAAQLEIALRLRRAHAENWSNDALRPYEELTLDERAALDAPLLAGKEAAPYIHLVPEADDLTPEEAEALAKKAVSHKYGVGKDALRKESLSFLLCTEENRREYWLEFSVPAAAGPYQVRLTSPAGEIILCQWHALVEERTLPTGDLAPYGEAVEEYIQSGAFALLSAAEKAQIAARIQAAGLDALLPEGAYLTPQSTDLSETQAQAAAQNAMERLYVLPPRALSAFFASRAALLLGNGQRVWQICYTPVEQPNWRWRDFEKLGTYTLTLDAADGSLLSCVWSLEGVEEGVYTEHTFGAAQAYTLDMLPWIESLLADLQSILDAYPEDINLGELSLADDAAYDARLQAAGYKQTYSRALPGELDISQEEALVLARQALEMEYPIEKKTLENGNILVSCILRDDQIKAAAKFWVIDFQLAFDRYTVWLFTDTGIVESIYHDSPASGNG